MSHEVYDVPKLNHGMLFAILGGLGVTVLILLVLPLTQWISDSMKRPELERQVDIVREPPQPPPPEPTEQKEQEQTEELELEAQAEQVDLTQLQIAITPGMGDVEAGTFSVSGFAVGPDALQDMQIFDIADLDRIPQVMTSPKFVIPRELERAGIRGSVRLVVLITPEGKVLVAGVDSTDHPRLVEHARAFAEKIRYESPMRNGQKVTTKFILPLKY